MIQKLIVSIIILVNLGCTSLQYSKVRSLPLEDFFKNALATQFRISPDGNHIAALMPYKKRFNVFVSKVNSKKWSRLTSVTDRDIVRILWKGNKTILYSRDFGGDENYQIFAVNIKTKKTRNLTPFKDTITFVLDDLSELSETDILIEMNKRNKSLFDVYRLNVSTGKLNLLEKNTGNYTSWITDHKGRVRMAVSTDGANKTIYFREIKQKKFQKIKTLSFKDTLSPLFFDFENKNIYALSNLGRNTDAVVLIDPKTLREKKLI